MPPSATSSAPIWSAGAGCRATLASAPSTPPPPPHTPRAHAKNAPRRDPPRPIMGPGRWLPRNLGERHIIVNVPAYTAAIVDNGQVIARHKTVGGSTKTPTPQLSATRPEE